MVGGVKLNDVYEVTKGINTLIIMKQLVREILAKLILIYHN